MGGRRAARATTPGDGGRHGADQPQCRGVQFAAQPRLRRTPLVCGRSPICGGAGFGQIRAALLRCGELLFADPVGHAGPLCAANRRHPIKQHGLVLHIERACAVFFGASRRHHLSAGDFGPHRQRLWAQPVARPHNHCRQPSHGAVRGVQPHHGSGILAAHGALVRPPHRTANPGKRTTQPSADRGA